MEVSVNFELRGKVVFKMTAFGWPETSLPHHGSVIRCSYSLVLRLKLIYSRASMSSSNCLTAPSPVTQSYP